MNPTTPIPISTLTLPPKPLKDSANCAAASGGGAAILEEEPKSETPAAPEPALLKKGRPVFSLRQKGRSVREDALHVLTVPVLIVCLFSVGKIVLFGTF